MHPVAAVNSKPSAKVAVVCRSFLEQKCQKTNAHLVSITKLFMPRLNLRDVVEFKGILSTTHVIMLKIIFTKTERTYAQLPRWLKRYAAGSAISRKVVNANSLSVANGMGRTLTFDGVELSTETTA